MMRAHLLATAAAMALAAGAAQAATLPATPATLAAALRSAQGGDTVALAAGTYSGLSLYHQDFGAGITLTSADPAHPAILTNFNMEAVQGLTFSRLDFKVLTPNWSGFNIYSSQHVTFDHVHVYGPAGAPVPDVHALNFFDSAYVAFTNNEIEQVATGAGFARSDHLTVTGNHIHHVNSDALDFGQVTDVMISGNVLHDFYPTDGNHPDAIQFGTYGTSTPSHDVTISDNLIYRGAGQNSQGVFMADDSVAGNLPFANVTVSNNVVIGTGPSAVRPTSCKGLTVTGNELLSLAGGDPTTLLVQGSDQVTHGGNSATSLSIEAKNGNTNITAGGVADIITQPVTQPQADAQIQKWLAAHAMGGAPAPDPRDAQIADLSAKLMAASAAVAGLTQQLADAKAGQAALQAQLATAQAALARDEAKLAGLRAAVAP